VARDLVRAREDVRGDLMSARHRLSKLLLRQGIVYYGGKPWTANHDLWLRAQRRAEVFTLPGLGLAYDTAYDTLLATVARRDRLDVAIAQMAAGSAVTPVVIRLGCLRGVSTLTAFGLAVEIGDWHRLSGRSIGAYLGLVPTESSSGGSRSRGSITKSGNAHARRLLIEAAWHHRKPYRTGVDPAAPAGPGQPRARSRAAGEPAPACSVGWLRRPPQAGRGRQHRDRPRARRLVLVPGRPRLTEAIPSCLRR
jgi:transposase